MRGLLLVSLIAITMTACSANKNMAATGGSKADGIVKMSYSYGKFEKPVIDKAQGKRSALKRCKAWGYTGVEPFEASAATCSGSDFIMGGCSRYVVTTEYQCLK